MATPSSQKSRGLRTVAVLAAVLGVAFLLIVSGTAQYGLVTGEEFAPRSFQRRTFVYYEVPWLGFQVSPISRTNTSNDLEKHLISAGLIVPLQDSGTSWDLVYGRRSTKLVTQGDAAVLCLYLDARDLDEQLYWQKWTAAHADLAKILWPEVAYLAREQLYVFIPRLFQEARSTTDPAQLQKAIKQTMAAVHLERAQILDRLGLQKAAAELRARAARYQSPSQPTQAQRTVPGRLLSPAMLPSLS